MSYGRRKIFTDAAEITAENVVREVNAAYLVHLDNRNEIIELYRYYRSVGAKGLENTLFREILEQIGKKISLNSLPKAVPVASAIAGALIDTAQMNKVLEYADIFYHKRFIYEKQIRIDILLGAKAL